MFDFILRDSNVNTMHQTGIFLCLDFQYNVLNNKCAEGCLNRDRNYFSAFVRILYRRLSDGYR